MPNVRPVLIIFASLSFLAQPASGQPFTTATSQPTRFDYRIEPVADLYSYVREQATRRGESDAPSEFSPAVAAARALRKKISDNVLLWAPLDEHLLTCKTAADLKRAFQGLPNQVETFGGTMLAIRDEAIAWADALIGVEPAHRKQLWPRNEAAIRRALGDIDRQFRPKESECIQFMLKSLGMSDPHDVAPVFLVQQNTWPGAHTIARPDGGGVCFVAVGEKNHTGTLLFETILHEATHALDLRMGDRPSVFKQLREKLLAVGVKPRDRDFRDIPHTLMFIQAGETIRRIVDPHHKHYGDVAGYYRRLGRVADVERPVWIDYLDGKVSRDAALDQIVERLTKKSAAPP